MCNSISLEKIRIIKTATPSIKVYFKTLSPHFITLVDLYLYLRELCLIIP